MIKPQDVRTDEITSEMIGRAHKIIASTGNFYKVSSSRDTCIEYSVKYSSKTGFTCGCEAGLRGFSNCKDGCCQHIKIAVACENEVKQAIAELEAAIKEQAAPVLIIDGKPASAVELERVMNAAAKPASRRAKAYEPRPFSLI